MSQTPTKTAPPAPQRPSSWVAMTPVVFVGLWSTGFIGAKLGMPYAEPFTFLLLRFIIVVGLLTTAALVVRAPWPRTWTEVRHGATAGLLIHGIYLGGVFAAIDRGVPAGIAALIVGLQPLLTAVASGPYLGERISPRQWLGVAIGLVGVTLVVSEKVTLSGGEFGGVGFAVAALLGITVGTLYQKRHGGGMNLFTGSAVQFASAGLFMFVAAVTFETMSVEWTGEFVFALGWLVVVLSLGAITLLYLLIRRGAAAKVASLFYLVPPVTAVMAFVLFGETLGPMAIAGMAAAVVGVALVTRG